MHKAGNEEAGGRKLTHPLGQLHLQGCLSLARWADLPAGIEGIRLCPEHMCLMQMSPGLSLKKKDLPTEGACSQVGGLSSGLRSLRNSSFEPRLVPACPGRPCCELCSHIISPTSLS